MEILARLGQLIWWAALVVGLGAIALGSEIFGNDLGDEFFRWFLIGSGVVVILLGRGIAWVLSGE